MADKRTDPGRERSEPARRRRMDRDQVLAVYQKALGEFDEVQDALAARILAGQDTTPEQALRDDAARLKLENARALLWALPLE